MPCPICEHSLVDLNACPNCDPVLVERFNALDLGSYPAIAMPPMHGLNSGRAADLRRSILNGDAALADSTWLVILRGLHGVGAAERALQADCWDAYAFFLEHQGRTDEARRAHQRAATARKDPSELKRKQDGVAEARLGASADSLKRLHSDEYHQPDAEAVRRVQEELDRQLAAQARREKVMKVGGLSLAGLVGGTLIGIPATITGTVGAGLGWAWSRHTA